MHSFAYQNNQLYGEYVNLKDIAEEYGTPIYVYSSQTIKQNYQNLVNAFDSIDLSIAYAVKANSNLSILKLLKQQGSRFDIVSAGELYRVIQAGGSPAKCTFAGVGKTKTEIEYALKKGIYCFNVESENELEQINNIAGKLGVKAAVSLRINPNVDAKTHKYISTGTSENKFGIDYERALAIYQKIETELVNLIAKGVQIHIGSQLTQVAPFIQAVEKMLPLVTQIKQNHPIEFFSIGGGIGIIYEQALESGNPQWWKENPTLLNPVIYAQALEEKLEPLDLKIILEPGRYLVGNAGILLTTCLYEKAGNSKTFKIVDAGMNDLIRPALYQGYHQIVPLLLNNKSQEKIDVVGPVCETGDSFCENREVANFQKDQIIAIMSSGAYSASMGSNYNSRPLLAEVLIEENSFRLIRRRQSYQDLVSSEVFKS